MPHRFLPLPPAGDSEPSLREPEIVLTWLTRLRWLAVIGQLTATVVALMLRLNVALPLIGSVLALTVLTNVSIHIFMKPLAAQRWLVPAVLLLDILLLTLLLYGSGGAENPFSILYVVHVVMAVAVLGAGWTWAIVILSALCYAALFYLRVPLELGNELPRYAAMLGQWAALVLVTVLIAYFVGRVTFALRQRDAELTAVREVAARSEQLASLTTLAAGAAHELGSPLGTIAVVAKELEIASSSLADQSIQDDARLIRREVDRCRTILDRMRIDLVESLRQAVRSADVGHLIELLKEDLTEPEWARLRFEVKSNAAVFVGPVRAVVQSLAVLIRNSIDASPAGSPVSVTIYRVDRSMVFEVEDHGHGMNKDVLRRAGEPFFTTKQPGSGMGLGLFLVRLVAERCGGRFEITSEPERGTRSLLEIPDASIPGQSATLLPPLSAPFAEAPSAATGVLS